MIRQTASTRRFGVFATARGWLMADSGYMETFESRADAVRTARRLAHLARWRGGDAEVVAQELPGGQLRVIDPAEAPRPADD